MGDWAERLAAKPLPALRDSHARLSRLVGREDTTNWQIEDVLRRDPALALAVLGETNRQARRFGREDVTTFDSAISLLGRERLKSVVRALPEICISLLDPGSKTGFLTALARTLEAAQQAEDWALARREPVAEQHFHAALLSGTPHRIALAGHTDETPFQAPRGYGNWELSSDRANAARRELLAGGMQDQKILRVVGLGSANPLDKQNVINPINRRIAIVVLNKQSEEQILGEHPPEGTAANGEPDTAAANR